MKLWEWVRVLRESELQKTQLLRDKQKNGHQEADGKRRMGGKQGGRESREDKEDMT